MAEIRVQRVVGLTVPEVWRAFTLPDRLAHWFWPRRFETEVSIDLRVGGSFRIASSVADLAVTGEYQEIESPGRLVHTWRFDGEDDETLVTMSFLELEGGTGITILHERFASEETAKQNEEGWNSCLERLSPSSR